MATQNKRVFQPQAHTINSIAAGGLTQHKIECGYDDVLQNPVDGLGLAMADLLTEFVRGSFTSQDWVHIIELLTGTVGTSVFYQRKSGEAEVGGYIKHTLNNPIIHRVNLSIRHRGLAAVSGNFECKAADENDGIADMWTQADSQSAPTYNSAERGLEILACELGSLDILHVVGLNLTIEIPIMKASHDGDVGYTAVDAILTGLKVSGSLTIQDAGITTSQLKVVQMLTAVRNSLVLTIKQSQGESNKTLTIAGVKFTTGAQDSNSEGKYDEFSVPFIITNNTTTPLTLAGANKIITVA